MYSFERKGFNLEPSISDTNNILRSSLIRHGVMHIISTGFFLRSTGLPADSRLRLYELCSLSLINLKMGSALSSLIKS